MIVRQSEEHPHAALAYYNSTSTDGIVSSSVSSIFNFGITANYVKVQNLGAVNLWARLGGTAGTTSLASTADLVITTCAGLQELVLTNVPIDGVTIHATSTATSVVSILAVG